MSRSVKSSRRWPVFLARVMSSRKPWYASARRSGRTPCRPADVAVHGYVADSGAKARTAYLEYDHRMMGEGMAELGRPAPPRTDRAAAFGPVGMVFVGSPDEIADRILTLHDLLGHIRQVLQVDIGGMPHRDFLHAIGLLGTGPCPRYAPSRPTAEARCPRQPETDASE
ncbi:MULTISPECIES: hypothetical protein [unclassified Streptomyces]|uniref:hypothetical protein n=1 Tax=unclassified Streptomyces TaxID=2593676 RepID=UPI003450E1B9